MNRLLPTEYVIQKFYQFAGYPKYKKGSNIYNGGCNQCKEGTSWGKNEDFFIFQKRI